MAQQHRVQLYGVGAEVSDVPAAVAPPRVLAACAAVETLHHRVPQPAGQRAARLAESPQCGEVVPVGQLVHLDQI